MAAKVKTKKETKRSVKTQDKKGVDVKKKVAKKLRVNPFFKYLVTGIFLIILGLLIYMGRGLFIAAIVSGKPITRLELVKQLEKQSGKQTLDNLITKRLITNEAEKRGIQVSQEDVQKEIERISKLVESQGSTLDAALSVQGQTREDLEENIRIQKIVEELLKEEIQISDEDISKYFEDNKSFYGKNAKFEDLKEDIRQQLKQEKLSTAFSNWIQKLKNDAQIIYFVNY